MIRMWCQVIPCRFTMELTDKGTYACPEHGSLEDQKAGLQTIQFAQKAILGMIVHDLARRENPKGLYYECNCQFCGADLPALKPHDPGCVWARARRLLGLTTDS